MATSAEAEVEGKTMRAITRARYGQPDTLVLAEVPKPEVDDDKVLVKVHASSVNALEWHFLTGTPYLVRLNGGLFRPKKRTQTLGADVAGTVEAVGKEVTQFKPGDEVMGDIGARGYAEYVTSKERGFVHKPAGVSFEQAAAMPVAGLTALQGLRDRGGIEPGQKVLVIGASGGVGTFAVQIAKAFGAEVTAVCSTRNVEQAREIGADRVIDYTKEDFAGTGEKYNLVVDIPGSRPIADIQRVLSSDGTYVIIGGPKGNWLGPLGYIMKAKRALRKSGHTMAWFVAEMNQDDLSYLADMVASGDVVPVIEKEYPLEDAAEAVAYLGEGHVRGKLIIKV